MPVEPTLNSPKTCFHAGDLRLQALIALKHLGAQLVETECREVAHLAEVIADFIESRDMLQLGIDCVEAGVHHIEPGIHGIKPRVHRLRQLSNAHRHHFLEVLRHIDDDLIVRSDEQARRSARVHQNARCPPLSQELETGAPASDGDVVRRILLLSDGLANVGETDPTALAQHATALRAKGITTSTFGLGADFDETLMSNLSASGGGHFYFIEKPVQISDFFLSEIGEALEVVARDARVVIAGAPGIEISCLNQFPVERTEGGDVSIRLGDLTSEQEVTTIIGVRCTAGAIGDTVGISVRLTDRECALFGEPMPIEWRVTDAIADDAQPIGTEVLIEVAKLLADGARTRALEANRRGVYDRAAEILRAEAAAIRALAPGNSELDAIADELFGERELFQEAMTANDIKGRHFASMNAMYSRSPQGRARKRGAV